ncbi:hypothetical protein [Proteiniphilum sp. X52]|uniref:hypothetical protein n=1 Tax=Proteiniphilum sp. X52 TaxID=2382159 RepID=UPI000F0A00CB|nr:hypothetical protein [Proteiniphilum sp. X52]RNC66161.1 hypothetical protein D7D25_04325 [Proteiniphilum sp. X52]
MKRYSHLAFLFLLFIALSCKSKQQVTPVYQIGIGGSIIGFQEQQLIDSILQYALDYEAIYTLLGNIKPMSSVKLYRFPLANTDSLKQTSANIVDREKQGTYLDRLYAVQQAVNRLDFPDLKFVLIPYKSVQDSIRMIQLSVVRMSSLDSLLQAKEEFFGQFGLVPGADPAVVVSTIENADRYERYRGYGYLFGYPDYAVDFFVEAALESSKTKKTLPRKFFQIPVYAREAGSFTYAYPESHTPTIDVDSTVYYRSGKVLEEYKKIRNNYLNTDSSLRAYQLLQDFYKQSL